MFHSRQLNKKMNKIQERALRIAYKDAESTYSELSEKDCAVTIHTKNLQLLMTEMYKLKTGLTLYLCRKSSVKMQLTKIYVTITNLYNPE